MKKKKKMKKIDDEVIEIRTASDLVVQIWPDGRVIVNPKFSADEAATVFWEAVVNHFRAAKEAEPNLTSDPR